MPHIPIRSTLCQLLDVRHEFRVRGKETLRIGSELRHRQTEGRHGVAGGPDVVLRVMLVRMKVPPQFAPAAVFGLLAEEVALRLGDDGVVVRQAAGLEGQQHDRGDEQVTGIALLDAPAAIVAPRLKQFVEQLLGPRRFTALVLIGDPAGQAIPFSRAAVAS